MPQQHFEKWMTIEEAEEHTGYSRTTISRWLNDADHPLDHLADGRGGKVMIACSTLDAYMHARAARTTAKRRVHFVSDGAGLTPTLCGRIRDGLLLSSNPDETTCVVCREVLTAPERAL